jgi:O-methyltransferase involved in polyketide biosynthesis
MIKLDKEKETLLVPLFGKAIESRKKNPILTDSKAMEIVEKIDYDFNALKIPGKTNMMICLRAKLIDNFTGEFLHNHPNSIVLHLGCGLDSRYTRIKHGDVIWYDLDYTDVIDIRRHFFPETENYHLIPSSVTNPEWVEKIPETGRSCLVIAEGLFMYLKEEKIKSLLNAIKEKVGHYTLIFDAFSVFTSKKVKHHPSIKKTGATVYWGIDNPEVMVQWNTGIKFIKEIYFTSNEEIDRLGFRTRFVYKIAHLFPIARKAQRIMIYEMGEN